jgi:hypothetical protein
MLRQLHSWLLKFWIFHVQSQLLGLKNLCWATKSVMLMEPSLQLQQKCKVFSLCSYDASIFTYSSVNILNKDASQNKYSSSSLIRPHLLQRKSGLLRGVASLEGGHLVSFYYLIISASEIWPDMKGGHWLEGLYKRGGPSWGGKFSSILLSQCISIIWPDMRGGLWLEGLHKMYIW